MSLASKIQVRLCVKEVAKYEYPLHRSGFQYSDIDSFEFGIVLDQHNRNLTDVRGNYWFLIHETVTLLDELSNRERELDMNFSVFLRWAFLCDSIVSKILKLIKRLFDTYLYHDYIHNNYLCFIAKENIALPSDISRYISKFLCRNGSRYMVFDYEDFSSNYLDWILCRQELISLLPAIEKIDRYHVSSGFTTEEEVTEEETNH
jgi:hypothetical protein